jgi:rod shape determining protein RodA
MNNQNRSFFFNVDYLTIILYLCLMAIGWFNIHAAVYNPDEAIINLSSNSGKQLIYIILAIIVAIVILLLDSKFFLTFAPVFYGITILLLIAVLVVGRNVGGNQAWIPIGNFRLQPSEFAKWATSLLLARHLGIMNSKLSDLKTLLPTLGILGLPVLLIILQPDAGSALVFASLIFVLYREGLSPYFLIGGALMILLFVITLLYPKVYIIIGLFTIVAVLIYQFRKNRNLITVFVSGLILSLLFIFSVDFVYTSILKPHQKVRIDLILGKVNDLRGVGYNVNQSKIAIGSGGLIGKGYLQGTQTKFNFVPEQSTDFIFCTVGEEWGFVGSFIVIGLYVFLLLRIIHLAERQRSPFGRVYGYAVACIIFCHFFVNIAMTIGIMPVIGIPLPFISYGGSSLLSFTILLFTLIKFDSNRLGIV